MPLTRRERNLLNILIAIISVGVAAQQRFSNFPSERKYLFPSGCGPQKHHPARI
jgi:hypothetical protein